MINEQELINKIKQKGYWKVIIRPTKFIANRFDDLGGCESPLIENRLSLRGWDYPHIEPIEVAGSDSIRSLCDWSAGPMYEAWRFYKNGMFVHLFSMREDLRLSDDQIASSIMQFGTLANRDIESLLDIISTLYTVTEIFLFASNLAKNLIKDDMQIIIELNMTKNRLLFFWGNPFRYLSMPYVCNYEPVKIEKTISYNELMDNPNEIALDTTIEILKQFNWKNVKREMFIEDQRKFIEKHL